MSIATQDQLIDYCVRNLGAPVIEINVDEQQLDDRFSEAMELYREFHDDALHKTYLKHILTQTDLTNEYITLSTDISGVTRVFPFSSSGNTSNNMFSLAYQMRLNEMHLMSNFTGNLQYYFQMQQYMSMLDMTLNGSPQVKFQKRMNRLYIFGDIADNNLKVGDYVVAEVYQMLDPVTFTSIYDDRWLKDYLTALIKRQWGRNMGKFDGIAMLGGITISGKQIEGEANEELKILEEKLRLEHELPVDFMVG
jgi:hypothetical protein